MRAILSMLFPEDFPLTDDDRDLIFLAAGLLTFDTERNAAVLRLASHMHRKLAKPRARWCLVQLSFALWGGRRTQRVLPDLSPAGLLRDWFLPAGILFTLTRIEHPTKVRLGRRWVTDPDGRKREIIPLRDLTVGPFRQWFFAETYREAAEAVVDTYLVQTGGDANLRGWSSLDVLTAAGAGEAFEVGDDHRVVFANRYTIPLVLTRARRDELQGEAEEERQQAIQEMVAQLTAKASPRQRQLFALLKAGCTKAQAAQALGLAPSTVRVQLHRVREKCVDVRGQVLWLFREARKLRRPRKVAKHGWHT